MTTAAPSRQVERITGRDESMLRTGSMLMALGSVAFIGYAIAFFVRNFTDDFLELGISPEQVDVGRTQIEAFSPQLLDYVSHLHIAVSGFIAGTGVAVLMLSWFGVRRGMRWAWIAAVASPVIALAVALPAHYPWGFATLGHLGPIYVATVVFVAGALLAIPSLFRGRRRGEPSSRDPRRAS